MLVALNVGWVAESIRMFPATFPNISLEMNALFLGLALIAYCVALRLWFGSWLYLGQQMNIPILLIYCSFWSMSLVVFNLAGAFFIDGFDRAFLRFARQMGTTNVLAVSLVYSISSTAMTTLAKRPDAVPVFWRVRAPKVDVPDARGVPAQAYISYLDGNLRWVSARNKRVSAVTTAGETFLKKTLQEVVDVLDPSWGWHCHRSLWIAKAEVARIVYAQGNPQVETQCGLCFPVSRAAVVTIRDHLERARL